MSYRRNSESESSVIRDTRGLLNTSRLHDELRTHHDRGLFECCDEANERYDELRVSLAFK